jgi:hypothetical protein
MEAKLVVEKENMIVNFSLIERGTIVSTVCFDEVRIVFFLIANTFQICDIWNLVPFRSIFK